MRPLLLEAAISIASPAGMNFKVAREAYVDDVTRLSQSYIKSFPINYYNFVNAIGLF